MALVWLGCAIGEKYQPQIFLKICINNINSVKTSHYRTEGLARGTVSPVNNAFN